ncbi:type ISP restriction/modification enzyme [Rufibacter hautae]|uniref:site-specific DNA-methyltransferase (adenine-specific) n=1 Tax=Rufibacter hautae TaxID=2595005 RepID=A0A5B6T8X5_9BACT|nr:type ISP restriction/modification enzyme [Rufibacter hautae]KAA3435950.1 N-6 DNA methylase [Rufibacter hautae]
MISLDTFEEKLIDLAEKIKNNFSSSISANPEDQLKRPISEFIESLIPGTITTRTEVQVEGLGARPDMGVARENLLCGHIELKATHISLKNLKGANKKQFEKFKALPNLIYTNCNEWVLYKSGEKEGAIIEFNGDVIRDGCKAINREKTEQLYKILFDFINWNPIVPRTPKSLANLLAPICKLLRSDVEIALKNGESKIHLLYKDWQRLFFPEADQLQFADAYAQTLTYALLLARLSGAEIINPESAATYLDSGHSLLAQTLRLLGQKDAREEMKTAVELLQRIIGAVDFVKISKKGDPWLYFYEDFLTVYDPKLRKDYGVYYTPLEVVECQIKLCSELLKNKFNKPLAFADENVTFLDPATGTAAYPLIAIQHGLQEASQRFGEGMIASIATRMANNFYAFENMVGPYAVSHMRITQLLKNAGGSIPDDGIKVFLTDTLEDPAAEPPKFSFAERVMAKEHIRAQNVKNNTQILVCIGNPPYNREQREVDDQGVRRKGGWIRFGSNLTNTNTSGILKDFIDGVPGVHVKNLYNDYVYFWRWALWKLYENASSSNQGIISFITASSYLRGPAFSSMRKKMREAFDELWIIDLEGDNLGARKTENIFNIQTPVAISIGFRKDICDSQVPANVWYSKVTGTRAEKLSFLSNISSFKDISWQLCFEEWEKPMLPKTSGDYFSYPLITDIFPWQHSGVQFKRKWPIASQKEILVKRWRVLVSALDLDERRRLFGKEGDRPISKDFKAFGVVQGGKKISSLKPDTPTPQIKSFSFRSFDRQYCLVDNRLAARIRPELWSCYSEQQVFITSIFSQVLGEGIGLVATSSIPDLNFFCGRGGKDVIPLWKDVDATIPNITETLLENISKQLGEDISPKSLLSYCYSLLSQPEYTSLFSEELINPGLRVPITKDLKIFKKASEIGERLLFLHTYAERFIGENEIKGQVPPGLALCTKAVPTNKEEYPEDFSYDEYTLTLKVGKGEFSPVAREIYEFSISGWDVVKKWLSYRMKGSAGKLSSPLDDILPEIWTADYTKELLELLWILEHTIALYPLLKDLLTEVINSNCFNESELPKPKEVEKYSLKEQGILLG